ncbi:tetratricopeptide repeat [Mactra antiquata]
MSTNCECASNIPNFCLLQGKAFGDTPKDKDGAIEVYTYCINETKKCLSFTENPVSKEKLCKQIAIGYNERGFMKYQKVDFDSAIADYSKALSYDASLYFTFYNRGLIHYRLGRFNEAIADMKEALSLHPDFEPAKQCLAQANIDKSRPKHTDTFNATSSQNIDSESSLPGTQRMPEPISKEEKTQESHKDAS